MTSKQLTNCTETPTKHNIQNYFPKNNKQGPLEFFKISTAILEKPLTTPVSFPNILPPAFFYKTTKIKNK